MWSVPKHFKIRLGGATFIDTPVLVEHYGTPLVTVKRHDNGDLGIYFDIYNEHGEKLAVVKRNEIYTAKGKKEDYRIDGSADRLTFTEITTGHVLCDIRKREEAGDVELDVTMRLYTPPPKILLLEFNPTFINLPGHNKLIGCTVRNVKAAIGIGPPLR